jgi:hypothetical protein
LHSIEIGHLNPHFVSSQPFGTHAGIEIGQCVWRLRSLWMLSPLIVPILLLAFGIIFRNAGVTATWPVFVVEWSAWLLLPLGLTLLARFRSISTWIIILGISTAAAWLSLGSGFLSSMSVTNNWL